MRLSIKQNNALDLKEKTSSSLVLDSPIKPSSTLQLDNSSPLCASSADVLQPPIPSPDLEPSVSPSDNITAVTSQNNNDIQAEENPFGVPSVILSRIDDTIHNYCIKFKVDNLQKASAEVWQGACIMVGKMFQGTKLLRDSTREKLQGGVVYDPQLVLALVDVWQALCTAYDKAPLACDFVYFSGVSHTFFYGDNGSGGVTRAGDGIYKKVLKIQEAGLGARLVDGKRNPTGTIFFLKNWHGWRDQREVIHTDGGSAAPVNNYPDFPLLADSSGSDDGI